MLTPTLNSPCAVNEKTAQLALRLVLQRCQTNSPCLIQPCTPFLFLSMPTLATYSRQEKSRSVGTEYTAADLEGKYVAGPG